MNIHEGKPLKNLVNVVAEAELDIGETVQFKSSYQHSTIEESLDWFNEFDFRQHAFFKLNFK